MPDTIREYIPVQNNHKANTPQPSYELKASLAGKKAGPIIIGYGNIKCQVPHAPKSNCKKCYGKGHLGIVAKTNTIILCHKCYPPPK